MSEVGGSGGPGSAGGERATPFYCPYCGDEDIEPDGAEAGRFGCRSCARHFVLRFVGLRVRR